MEKKYRIYEVTIQDNKYYPDGMNVYLANDKDMKIIDENYHDDLIYFYVDDKTDLSKVKTGDVLELDVDFKVLDINSKWKF